MAGSPADEVQRSYVRARELIGRGRQAIGEGHRLLKGLAGSIVHARTRGQLNQQIWDCERLSAQRSRFFSQAGQDAFLDARVFKGKRDGVFVEIGGYDGVTGSNCLFFEMFRGWSGLLIEPSPTFFEQAAEFRRATCLQLAVAAEEGEAEFMEVLEGFSQMSGLVDTYDPKLKAQVEEDPRHKGRMIKVKTRPLADILERHGLRVVDYISLDVEGGEMDVLAPFPFDQIKVTAWTVENNAGDTEIPALMKDKGYARIEALGVDDVYVLEGALSAT